MEASYPDSERWKYDPSAPPDWRAQDAARLVAGERPKWADANDDYVRDYVEYLRSITTAANPSQTAGEAPQPTIAAAHDLHHEGGLRRPEVEARLVAGQSDSEIAENCGIAPEIVAIYEQVFCCIRYCLNARDYLRTHLIGRGLHCGFQDDEVGRFWLWAALGHGPAALDPLVEAFRAASREDQPARVSIYLEPGTAIPRNVQSMVASAVLPRNDSTAGVFLEGHLLLLEAKSAQDPDRAAFLRERASEWIIRCARAHLVGKPFPRPRRRQTAMEQDCSVSNPTRKAKLLTLEQWEAMIVAEFSDNPTKNRRKP